MSTLLTLEKKNPAAAPWGGAGRGRLIKARQQELHASRNVPLCLFFKEYGLDLSSYISMNI